MNLPLIIRLKSDNMKYNITSVLSRYIEEINYKDLPKDIMDTAKKSSIDFLAVSIAGFHKDPLTRILYDKYKKISGKSESTILGTSRMFSTIDAAFMNGVSGHSLDFDDGHRVARGHPGVTVIPAVLVLAEKNGLSGQDVILSVVVGYEIFVRLAKATNPFLFDK